MIPDKNELESNNMVGKSFSYPQKYISMDTFFSIKVRRLKNNYYLCCRKIIKNYKLGINNGRASAVKL